MVRPMLDTLQILFLGELAIWLKVAQAVVEAPGASVQMHRATSLRDAMHCLASERWDAVFLDLHHGPAKELLLALQLHSVFHAVPAVALLACSDAKVKGDALSSGAAACLDVNRVTAEAIQEIALAAINSKKSAGSARKDSQMQLAGNNGETDRFPSSRIELVFHALNNLLCVINANADVLADQVDGSQPAVHSVDQIKKAAKNAAELMRQLKTS
jgi:DNA-binding NtrC family response regulator